MQSQQRLGVRVFSSWHKLTDLNELASVSRQSTVYTAECEGKDPLTGFGSCVVSSEPVRMPVPPFTEQTAWEKVKAAERVWNSRNPHLVAQAYTKDTLWRNRDTFLIGREAVEKFLKDKWEMELEYKLVKNLWSFNDNRIAVRFTYEFKRDTDGQWFRCHGNELWQFDEKGYMEQRDMSGNNIAIKDRDRLYKNK